MNFDRVFNNDCTIFCSLSACLFFSFRLLLYSDCVSIFHSLSHFSFFLFNDSIVFVDIVRWCIGFMFYAIEELPSTKLHTLLLDHHSMKLTWYIDWPKKEVLFNVDEAFTDDTDWFSFGFSKRGQIEGSDVCYFVKSIYDESYNEAIVSIRMSACSIEFRLYILFLSLSFFFARRSNLLYVNYAELNLGHVHRKR